MCSDKFIQHKTSYQLQDAVEHTFVRHRFWHSLGKKLACLPNISGIDQGHEMSWGKVLGPKNSTSWASWGCFEQNPAHKAIFSNECGDYIRIAWKTGDIGSVKPLMVARKMVACWWSVVFWTFNDPPSPHVLWVSSLGSSWLEQFWKQDSHSVILSPLLHLWPRFQWCAHRTLP